MDSMSNKDGNGNREDLLQAVKAIAGSVLQMDPDHLDEQESLGYLGFDSASLKLMATRLSERFATQVDTVLLFAYPSLQALSDYLADSGVAGDPPNPVVQPDTKPEDHPIDRSQDVAIVGLACRFPGARTKEEFWTNQAASRNCISEVPKDRWDCDALFGDPHLQNGHTDVKWGGFIEGVDLFSPEFFGISTYEAELMDPQHRLFLKAAWEALWDAGYDPKSFAGRHVGIFAGVQFQDYQKLVSDCGIFSAQVCTGNAHAMIANRVSFLLDVHGPSEVVDTACSSSLVAIHNAVRAIRRGDCELAIAGGVNLLLTPDLFIMGRQLGVLSPTGQCRTFDAKADGYVRAEGVGAMMLKSFADAVRDRDHIYGVIKGTAVNHGGKATSLTAPNSRAQSDLVIRTLRDAKLTPNDISYVEMHGTGTELGDPIEIEGLKAAFRKLRAEDNLSPSPCAIGSVKTNIGHLEPAAGVAGVTNVLMAMQNQMLPGLSNFQNLNPHIVLSDGLQLQAETGPWPVGQSQALPAAVVNSFGFGGTNASVVLQHHFAENRDGANEREVFVPVAGSSQALLKAHAQDLAHAIGNLEGRDGPGHLLADIAFTLQNRCENRPVRSVIRTSSLSNLKHGLEALASGNDMPGVVMTVQETSAGQSDLPPHVGKWLKNGKADWPDISAARRCSLPISPWPDKSCWFEERKSAAAEEPDTQPAELTYLQPVWVPSIAEGRRSLDDKCIWVIGRTEAQIETFAATLQENLSPKTTLVTSVLSKPDIGPEPSLEVWNLAGDEPDIIVVLPCDAEMPDGDHESETRILFALTKDLMERSFGHPVDVLYVAPHDFGIAPAIDALPALAKSAFLEHEPLRINTLFFNEMGSIDWHRVLTDELIRAPAKTPETIRYSPSRMVLALQPVSLPDRPNKQAPWFRQDAIYLVPGGAGELGTRLLERLVADHDAIFVILGRSPLAGSIKERIDALAAKAGRPDRIQYRQCDIADLDQTRAVVDAISDQYGDLSGILNLVTAHKDAYLFNKVWEDFAETSASKIQGSINLDLATADLPIDFFVAFSSLASLGMAGGSDYAYGCAFQNAFASWRTGEVAAGRRHGASHAINWSRWKWDKYVTQSFDDWFASMGFKFLDIDAGLDGWRTAMNQSAPESFVLYGWQDRIFTHLDLSTGLLQSQHKDGEAAAHQPQAHVGASTEDAGNSSNIVASPPAQPAATMDIPPSDNAVEGSEQTQQVLLSLVGELLKLDQLDPHSKFASIGLDSVMAIRLIMLIEQKLSKRLTPKELLKYSSVAELATHLSRSAEPLDSGVTSLERAHKQEPELTTEQAIPDVASHLASGLKTILRADEIATNARFADIGVDSIIAVKLAMEFDKRYGVGISPRWFIDFPSIDRMADEIERRASVRS